MGKPLPVDTLKARDSWRANGHTEMPRDEVAAPDRPDWLDPEARAEWGRLVPLLEKRRTLSRESRGVLAGLCQHWSLYVRACERLNELMIDPDVAGMDLRRWTAIANESYKHYLKSAQEFGLTPASWSRVQIPPEPEKTDDDSLRYFDGAALG